MIKLFFAIAILFLANQCRGQTQIDCCGSERVAYFEFDVPKSGYITIALINATNVSHGDPASYWAVMNGTNSNLTSMSCDLRTQCTLAFRAQQNEHIKLIIQTRLIVYGTLTLQTKGFIQHQIGSNSSINATRRFYIERLDRYPPYATFTFYNNFMGRVWYSQGVNNCSHAAYVETPIPANGTVLFTVAFNNASVVLIDLGELTDYSAFTSQYGLIHSKIDIPARDPANASQVYYLDPSNYTGKAGFLIIDMNPVTSDFQVLARAHRNGSQISRRSQVSGIGHNYLVVGLHDISHHIRLNFSKWNGWNSSIAFNISQCEETEDRIEFSQCLSHCPIGTYATLDDCKPCMAGCKACHDNTECGECEDNYILQENGYCKEKAAITWIRYQRCADPWGRMPFGSPPQSTVCDSGAQLVAFANMLSRWGITEHGEPFTPNRLSRWLTRANGFSGLIIHPAALKPLGVTVMGRISRDGFQGAIARSQVVIARLRNRDWAIITETSSDRAKGFNTEVATGMEWPLSEFTDGLVFRR